MAAPGTHQGFQNVAAHAPPSVALTNTDFAKQASAQLTTIEDIEDTHHPHIEDQSPPSSFRPIPPLALSSSASASQDDATMPIKRQRTDSLMQDTIAEALQDKRREYEARFQPLLARAQALLPSAAYQEMHQEISRQIDEELSLVQSEILTQLHGHSPLPPG